MSENILGNDSDDRNGVLDLLGWQMAVGRADGEIRLDDRYDVVRSFCFLSALVVFWIGNLASSSVCWFMNRLLLPFLIHLN